MPLMLDVSDEVRAEIGDEEADRLLNGVGAPGGYDCTSCRTPGDTGLMPTSTVLFVGQETAVLAFAHATCVPSQVVPVSEEQLRGAVQNAAGPGAPGPGAAPAGVPAQEPRYAAPAGAPGPARNQAVLSVTCGLVLCADVPEPALVVEPTTPVSRPGGDGTRGDEFLQLLLEEGFGQVTDVNRPPARLSSWSVLMAMGQLHAILRPGPNGSAPVAWWQAHQPLQVTADWRAAVNRHNRVHLYAAPVGAVGSQPREDLMREALDRAAAHGLLLGAVVPLAGT